MLGTTPCAFIVLQPGYDWHDEHLQQLRAAVRERCGTIAVPSQFVVVHALPETHSGKIMRRILRKIAENEFGSLGDTSTLADPSVVDALIEGRKNR